MLFRRRPSAGPAPESGASFRSVSSSSPSSVIGQNTRFRGDVRGRGPLRVRGQLKGTVSLEDRLTIDKGGQVEAEIHAAELMVAGSVQGNLLSRGTLTLRSTGEIQGNVQAPRFRVEQGGVMRGSVSGSSSGS